MGSYGHINCCRGGCVDYNHVVGGWRLLADCGDICVLLV